MQPEIVFAVYRPHQGKTKQLEKILATHIPTLRESGLITKREPLLVKTTKGEYIEIFEWKDVTSAEKAHFHPDIAKVWEKIGQVSDFISLNQLEESKKPFTHFTPVEL